MQTSLILQLIFIILFVSYERRHRKVPMYDTKVVIHNGVCTLAVPFLYTPFQNTYGTATERPQHIIHYVSGASQVCPPSAPWDANFRRQTGRASVSQKYYYGASRYSLVLSSDIKRSNSGWKYSSILPTAPGRCLATSSSVM